MKCPLLPIFANSLLLAAGLTLAGCGGGPGGEEAPAPPEAANETVAESAADGGAASAAAPGADETDVGAAGWRCELYDRVREEGTDDFDGTITEEAEAFVARTVRAALAEREVEVPEDEVDFLNRIRAELATVCAADSTTDMSSAAAEIAETWPADG